MAARDPEICKEYSFSKLLADASIAAIATRIEVRPGEVILTQGEIPLAFYLVADGLVDRARYDGQTMRQMMAAAPGTLLGLTCSLQKTPIPYSAIATQTCRLEAITAAEWHAMADAHPPLRLKMLRLMAQELSSTYRDCVTALADR